MPVTVQGVTLKTTVQGQAEAVAAVQQMEREIRSARGAFRRAIGRAAEHSQRYARQITHVDTGELQAAHRAAYTAPLRAEVYIDQGRRNIRGGRPHIYGVYEHARGGGEEGKEGTMQPLVKHRHAGAPWSKCDSRTISEFLDRHCNRLRDKPVLIYEDGLKVTRGELIDRAESFAAWLSERIRPTWSKYCCMSWPLGRLLGRRLKIR